MPTLIVFSRKPETVSLEEFHDWYDTHVREILALPGFVAAERFELRFMRSETGEVPPFQFGLTLEIEGDLGAAWERLDAEASSGRMTMPDWMDDFTGWVWARNGLGGRVLAER